MRGAIPDYGMGGIGVRCRVDRTPPLNATATNEGRLSHGTADCSGKRYIGVRLSVLPSFSFPPVKMTGLGANRGHLF
jgi:hypothetical protein